MTPQDVLAWIVTHPELASTVVTAVAGVGAGARHYRRTGRVPLTTLPWRALRRLFYRVRKHVFTVRRPRTPTFVPSNTTLEDIRSRLGEDSYQPGWPLSYHYYGEDLNARRYYLAPTAEYPHRQLHVRGFELQDGSVELMAHDEPAPIHHPRAHLQEVDIHDATPWLESAWTSPALDPRTFDRSQTDGN